MNLALSIQSLARTWLRIRGFSIRYEESELGRFHVYDLRGSGALPPVVMLHGLGSGATPCARAALPLKGAVRRVFAPELPGHGFSDPPRQRLNAQRLHGFVAECLNREMKEPFVLVGNSLGGALAARYATTHPDRVLGLMLLSPAGAHMDVADLQRLLDSFRMETPADAYAFLGRLFHHRPFYARWLAADIQEVFARPWIRELLDSADPDDMLDEDELARLAMPVLFIWGKSERVLPPECLAWYRAHMPAHAVFEEPEACGHSMQIESPDRLAARLLRFIREDVESESADPLS